MYHSNKKFCFWERPEPYNIKIDALFAPEARENFQYFSVRLPYRDTILWCLKYWFFLPAPKVGGPGPPPSEVGGGSVPRPPGCYAYDSNGTGGDFCETGSDMFKPEVTILWPEMTLMGHWRCFWCFIWTFACSKASKTTFLHIFCSKMSFMTPEVT